MNRLRTGVSLINLLCALLLLFDFIYTKSSGTSGLDRIQTILMASSRILPVDAMVLGAVQKFTIALDSATRPFATFRTCPQLAACS